MQTWRLGNPAKRGLPCGGPDTDVVEVLAGTIILYDVRDWHRAGVNQTERKRGVVIQAIVPGFIMPCMDASATCKGYLASAAQSQVAERELKELDKPRRSGCR